MADREVVENSLAPIWRATANRVAVFAGAGTAFASLICDVPVRVAAFRGTLALMGVLVVARMTASALARAEKDVGEEVNA